MSFRKQYPKQISPVFFSETYLISPPVFLKSPCRETLKNALKKKCTYVLFVCELAQMYVGFTFYFFCRPLPKSEIQAPLVFVLGKEVKAEKQAPGGGAWEKNDKSDVHVHLPQRLKKSSYLLYFNFILF
jgi:hypothetical protein